jgi:hypothetical protein ELI_2922
MGTYVEMLHPMGGLMWKGNDLAGTDAGYSLVNKFIKEHWHDGWSLSIFDTITEATIEIACDLSEMPDIVAHIYNLEHAYPIAFIGENPITESYVIGMCCTRGSIAIPSVWKTEQGRLVNLA